MKNKDKHASIRRPPPEPASLVDALQDRIHREGGPARAAKSVKVSEPEPGDIQHCLECDEPVDPYAGFGKWCSMTCRRAGIGEDRMDEEDW